MRPRVVLHNAVSVDSRLLPFGMVDMGLYYGVAACFQEQATLAGSETLLVAEAINNLPPDADNGEPLEVVPGDSRPLLIVPDSRGRVRIWRRLMSQPYWRGGVALCTKATPLEYVAYLERAGVNRIVAGESRVDMSAALEELGSRFGIQGVRVDSGGTLNGVLLQVGLVDEISLLIAPLLAGDDNARPFYHVPGNALADSAISLRLVHCERLDGDMLWLRYEVAR